MRSATAAHTSHTDKSAPQAHRTASQPEWVPGEAQRGPEGSPPSPGPLWGSETDPLDEPHNADNS